MRGGTTNKKRKLNTCFEAYFYSQHPSEIWQMIVRFVSVYTLPILATTCSQFHDIIKHTRYSTLIVAKMYRQIGQIPLAYRCLMDCINLKNDAEAMFELGYAYRYCGWGVTEISDTISVHWFQRSAEAGNPRGMAFYSFYLKYGHGLRTRDMESSDTWAKHVFDTGKNDDFALGFCHYWDLGISSSSEKALKFFEKSKDEHGYVFVAKYHYFGVNSDVGLEFLSKAANLGLCIAQLQYARKLQTKDAIVWYQKAAAQGHPEAVNYIKDNE